MAKALIIYHSADPDGWCSAALMHALVTEHRNSDPEMKVVFDGYNYDHFPELDDDVTEVYMGDVSPPPQTMRKIIEKIGADSVFWWDHHMDRVRQIYDQVDHAYHIDGRRENGTAGCALILDWMKLRASSLYEKYSKNSVVEWVHLYDTWKHEYRDDILEFQAGIRMHPWFSPATASNMGEFLSAWKGIMSEDGNGLYVEAIESGYIAHKAKRAIWDADCERGETLHIASMGIKIFVVNTSNDPSLMFSQKIRANHDACIAWYYHQKKGKYKVSIRSTDGESALKVAKLLGGGGHPNAAGAWVDKEDWGELSQKWLMRL